MKKIALLVGIVALFVGCSDVKVEASVKKDTTVVVDTLVKDTSVVDSVKTDTTVVDSVK